MNTISETLRKQATAVKNNSNQIALAESLEATARQLRAEANKPVRFKFSDVLKTSKEKELKLKKFAGAMQKDNFLQAERLLSTNGWRPLILKSNKTGEKYFGRKDKPGLKLSIVGASFSVMYHDEQKQAETPLAYLGTYLEQSKK